ncbi:DUF943 family protein [Siccibacter colletis]|uniref:DUF943 family protein n=1 Tax=Siccibacter colletis TaxID=1505757 RepID=UPI003CF34D88
MRLFTIASIMVIVTATYYLFYDNHDVTVINAHYDGHTAQIIVDDLPLFDSRKTEWWQRSQENIGARFHIPSGSHGPFLTVIYAFGNGYQAAGKQDRLCFSNVRPPRNCIDKKILMMVWRTREGGVRYEF